MKEDNLLLSALPETETQSGESSASPSTSGVQRRSFLKGVGVAGAALAGGSLLTAAAETAGKTGVITSGDVAILRFLAAAELLEADLWQQYAELGGLSSGTQNPYQLALQNLDSDG